MTSVLLYSGGLDSYAAARVFQPDVLLHVDMATGYGDREAERLTVPPGVSGTLERVGLPLARWERADTIIPSRNAYLALLAANYGDTIWLAATAGDRVNDKDYVFAERINSLLEHLYAPQWWLRDGRRVRLQLPTKHLTKRRLVARYLDTGAEPAALARDTLSCYRPTAGGGHCAACKPCARKWVALLCNGIDPGYDASGYVHDAYAPAIRSGTWDRGSEEATDVLDALAANER